MTPVEDMADVHICAAADKSLDTVIAAVTSGIMQRGQATVGVILSPGLRCHLGWPIHGFRTGPYISALGNKKLHHLFRILIRGSCPHQRRLLLDLFDGVHVGSD